MSIERPVIAWSSRLWNQWSTFSNRCCFFRIWVLNNYILACNTHVQCMQALAVGTSGAQHVWCRHGVTHLSGRNKATSGSDHRPSHSLSSLHRWKADPMWYLHRSYFLPYRSADVFCFLSTISIFLSLGWVFTKLFLEKSISFISWLDTPLTADWLQVCLILSFLKRFWKSAYPAFNQTSDVMFEYFNMQWWSRDDRGRQNTVSFAVV